MKKKLLIGVTLLFLSGCYNSTNKVIESDNTSKSSENKIKKAVIIFDNTYRLVYNNNQEKNEVDKTNMVEMKPLLIRNFEKVENKINKSMEINVVPLTYTITSNQNGKFITFNIFVINTTDKELTNFESIMTFSFTDNSYSFSDSLNMKDIDMDKLSRNEGVIISYSQSIADQSEEYFNNLKLEDISINLSEVKIDRN